MIRASFCLSQVEFIKADGIVGRDVDTHGVVWIDAVGYSSGLVIYTGSKASAEALAAALQAAVDKAKESRARAMEAAA